MKKAVEDRLTQLWSELGRGFGWQDVVAEARKPKSPLHAEFEWDKSKAHEIYLRDRAQALIREWYCNQQAGNGDVTLRTRRAVNLPAIPEDIPTAPGPRLYYPIERVLETPSLRDIMLQEALQALSAVKRKYETLHELADAWKGIDKAIEKATRSAGKKQSALGKARQGRRGISSEARP